MMLSPLSPLTPATSSCHQPDDPLQQQTDTPPPFPFRQTITPTPQTQQPETPRRRQQQHEQPRQLPPLEQHLQQKHQQMKRNKMCTIFSLFNLCSALTSCHTAVNPKKKRRVKKGIIRSTPSVVNGYDHDHCGTEVSYIRITPTTAAITRITEYEGRGIA